MPRPKTKAATHAGTKDQKAHRPRGTRTDRQTKGQYHMQAAVLVHPKKALQKHHELAGQSTIQRPNAQKNLP